MKKLLLILTFISVNTFSETLYFKNCKEAKAKAKGYKNIKKGQPGYRDKLDRDKDGIACESK